MSEESPVFLSPEKFLEAELSDVAQKYGTTPGTISVIDSSSPSAQKRKPTKKRKPNRHNNRHHKEDARAMDSFTAGSRLAWGSPYQCIHHCDRF